ncbi:A24 family peptidase [Devosia sp.]|uniref:A24 family peptidase n=1 Tax=Devosia sp. TaxID=1871048 RepID=UPI002AFF76D2|nr:prepilin peptidase [Devosia sp.]
MSLLALLPFPIAMAWAATSDLLTMRISNALVLALGLCFVLAALAANLSLADFGLHLLAGLLVLLAGFAFFALRWIGGGDAKLAAATALWLGLSDGVLLRYLIYAGVLGGLLTLLLLGFRAFPLTPFIARHAWIARLHDKKTGVPYGVALALAGLLAFAGAPLFLRLYGIA